MTSKRIENNCMPIKNDILKLRMSRNEKAVMLYLASKITDYDDELDVKYDSTLNKELEIRYKDVRVDVKIADNRTIKSILKKLSKRRILNVLETNNSEYFKVKFTRELFIRYNEFKYGNFTFVDRKLFATKLDNKYIMTIIALKVYCFNESQFFKITHAQLGEVIGIKSKNDIIECVRFLEKNNIVEIKSDKTVSRKNMYKLLITSEGIKELCKNKNKKNIIDESKIEIISKRKIRPKRKFRSLKKAS